MIFAHYYFFTRYRDKTPANLAHYAWSHSGLMALALGRAVGEAARGAGGIKDGYQRCIKDLVSA